jgi:hypothetical protein
MEHRRGQRVGVDLPVHITGNSCSHQAGRLANLSASGAFIQTDAKLRVLARVLVVIETPPTARSRAPAIPAYVARNWGAGIGIAWCEFAPLQVTRILQSVDSLRGNRLRNPEDPAISTVPGQFTTRVQRYCAPMRPLCHRPLRAADANRSRANIALWNSYLLSDCVRSMVRMGWDYTT